MDHPSFEAHFLSKGGDIKYNASYAGIPGTLSIRSTAGRMQSELSDHALWHCMRARVDRNGARL